MTISPEVATLMNQAIAALFTVVIIPAILLGWKVLKAYGDAKIAQIEDMRVKAAAEFAFQRLDHIVNNTVAAISQVAPVTRGLTEEDKRSRRAKAIQIILSHLTNEDLAVLKGAVKDFDRYLITKIEATRYFQKKIDEPCPPMVGVIKTTQIEAKQ